MVFNLIFYLFIFKNVGSLEWSGGPINYSKLFLGLL
jgi:hypothetical protein